MTPPSGSGLKAALSLMDRRGEADEYCEGCGAEFYGWWQASRCADCTEYGDPCPKCGERGTMPGGDPDACLSAACLERRMAT